MSAAGVLLLWQLRPTEGPLQCVLVGEVPMWDGNGRLRSEVGGGAQAPSLMVVGDTVVCAAPAHGVSTMAFGNPQPRVAAPSHCAIA